MGYPGSHCNLCQAKTQAQLAGSQGMRNGMPRMNRQWFPLWSTLGSFLQPGLGHSLSHQDEANFLALRLKLVGLFRCQTLGGPRAGDFGIRRTMGVSFFFVAIVCLFFFGGGFSTFRWFSCWFPLKKNWHPKTRLGFWWKSMGSTGVGWYSASPA